MECNQTRHLAVCCAIEVPANRPSLTQFVFTQSASHSHQHSTRLLGAPSGTKHTAFQHIFPPSLAHSAAKLEQRSGLPPGSSHTPTRHPTPENQAVHTRRNRTHNIHTDTNILSTGNSYHNSPHTLALPAQRSNGCRGAPAGKGAPEPASSVGVLHADLRHVGHGNVCDGVVVCGVGQVVSQVLLQAHRIKGGGRRVGQASRHTDRQAGRQASRQAGRRMHAGAVSLLASIKCAGVCAAACSPPSSVLPGPDKPPHGPTHLPYAIAAAVPYTTACCFPEQCRQVVCGEVWNTRRRTKGAEPALSRCGSHSPVVPCLSPVPAQGSPGRTPLPGGHSSPP